MLLKFTRFIAGVEINKILINKPIYKQIFTVYISTQVECPKLEGSNGLLLNTVGVKTSDNRVYLFAVNRALEDINCQISIPGFEVKSSSGTILTAESLKSYNSFENPDTVIPREFDVNVSGEKFEISLPKHSLSVIVFE